MKQISAAWWDKKKKQLNSQIHNSEFSIKNDMFDIQAFQNILNQSTKIQNMLHGGVSDYEPFDNLLQDAFSSLYKYNVDLLKEYEINPIFHLNRAVMDEIMKSPKYKELRALTRLDEVNSTIGTEILSDQLKELIEKAKEQREALKKLIQAMKDADAADPDAEKGEGTPEQKLSYEEAQELLEKAKAEFDNSIQDKKFVQDIRNIVQTTQSGTNEISEYIRQWGLGSDPTYSSRSYKEKMSLLDRLRNSEKLRKIAQLAGRYKALAMQRQAAKIKKGNNYLHSIKRGKNLDRMLPTEKMKLGHPITKPIFLKDLTEGTTLQYDSRKKHREIKGPIVAAFDESYSMDGDKEIWSKSVGLGLLEIAIAQKRDFYAIHFSGDTNLKNLKVHYFSKENPMDVEQMIDFAEYFDGGGTYFEAPLQKAMNVIDEDPKFTKADIMFLTDGECAVSKAFCEKFNKWKEERNVTITSVMIDDGGYCTDVCLRTFTKKEHIIKLSELNEDSQDRVASFLFESI